MPYARGSGPKLYYDRRGAGEPLLWITGFTISAAVFDPILPLYEERFECVVYDNRASGRSDSPVSLTSIPEFAGDAVRVLDAAGIDSAHVYGLSMGGMIALEMAIRFPERVRGLVLGGTSPGGPRAFRPNVAEFAAAALGSVREPARHWLAGLLFSPEFRREHPDRVSELLTFFAQHRAKPHGMTAHLWATIYHDTVSRLGQIQAPTLAMHGGRDVMAPLENSRMLVERIPDAELAVIEGTGHAYLLERPEASRDRMVEWIDRRSPIEAGEPNGDLARAFEPVTRAFGLQVGMMRTGQSLMHAIADRALGRRG
jgi:pimeloyl-ACP methyl ester carboxylesterase